MDHLNEDELKVIIEDLILLHLGCTSCDPRGQERNNLALSILDLLKDVEESSYQDGVDATRV